MNSKISTIVLGCTHYPFVKNAIQDIVGEDVDIIDGSYGTIRELKRKLEKIKSTTFVVEKNSFAEEFLTSKKLEIEYISNL